MLVLVVLLLIRIFLKFIKISRISIQKHNFLERLSKLLKSVYWTPSVLFLIQSYGSHIKNHFICYIPYLSCLLRNVRVQNINLLLSNFPIISNVWLPKKRTTCVTHSCFYSRKCRQPYLYLHSQIQWYHSTRITFAYFSSVCHLIQVCIFRWYIQIQRSNM